LDGAALAAELDDALVSMSGDARRIRAKRGERDRRCCVARAHLATGELAAPEVAAAGGRRPLAAGGAFFCKIALYALLGALAVLLAVRAVGIVAVVAALAATPAWMTTRGARNAGAAERWRRYRARKRSAFVRSVHAARRTRLLVADPDALLAKRATPVLVIVDGDGDLSANDRSARDLATAALYGECFDAPVAPAGSRLARLLFPEATGTPSDLFSRRSACVFLGDGASLEDLVTFAATADAAVVPAVTLATRGGDVHALGAPLDDDRRSVEKVLAAATAAFAALEAKARAL
jgi:hypothetical protein